MFRFVSVTFCTQLCEPFLIGGVGAEFVTQRDNLSNAQSLMLA